ncbi:hypothetical protein TI05_02260 [Achromatium sp. WMS3]|nr:hypothetical protein TI05_02260 [Achromatium sp. WMS3]
MFTQIRLNIILRRFMLSLVLLCLVFLIAIKPSYAESYILKHKADANWHDCVYKPQTILYSKNLRQILLKTVSAITFC